MRVREYPLAVSALFMGLLAVGACVSEVSETPAPDPNDLMDADRAFQAAVEQGGSEAWVSWFASDGSMIQQGVGEIRGHAAVQEAAAFLDEGATLHWEPERADIAASGDLGWTTGSFVSRVLGPDGEEIEGRGRYVTIWRRQEDGRWRVVMDLGNLLDPPSPLP